MSYGRLIFLASPKDMDSILPYEDLNRGQNMILVHPRYGPMCAVIWTVVHKPCASAVP